MMTQAPDITQGGQQTPVELPHSHRDVQYPPSEIPMSVRDWIIAGAIIAAVLVLGPMNWRRVEPLPAAASDYRIPYERSDDYWLFEQLARQEARRGNVLVIGDSAVWGHYVPADATLSAQLNSQTGADRFANLGVDGIHPAALAGLIQYYGSPIAAGRVVLHCNLLWMSSPRHDLTGHKEFAFNHPRLVPQLYPWIDCYGEGVSARLAVAVGRELPSSRLAHHLQVAYFDGADIPAWTLDHPYVDPLAAITLQPPEANADGLPPGVTEETWSQRQIGMLSPEWVDLESSFQWRSFKRSVRLLRDRGNRVFVVIGPFNVHMLQGAGLATYRQRVEQAAAWLRQEGIAYWIAPELPTDEYADASHPLRAGYVRMAGQMLHDEAFAAFVSGGEHEKGSPR